jgi:hypothetical protein
MKQLVDTCTTPKHGKLDIEGKLIIFMEMLKLILLMEM